ncbi:hypothetical protein ACFWFU_30515 [Streptomyces sp. NPDC060235]|uniref:hypothetical protein n=1 Tax=Streptomyces sp. NPDC060235 TaxID=3347080 RepID=UPI0036673FB1
MSPRFVIQHRPDLSLADLLRIQASGGAVMRSAHFGNWSPSNLSVAAVGLRCVLINTTITGRDTTYHPTGVITGRRLQGGLARAGNALVTLSRVRQPPKSVVLRPFFPLGGNLASAHLDALAKAVPNAALGTYADLLREHEDLAAAVLEIATDRCPDLWQRRADVHRGVEDLGGAPQRPRRWADLCAQGIVGFAGATEGWLIPKTLIILTMAVIDALTHQTSKIYHLSGPSMVQYIGRLSPDLQHLYQAVAPKLALPQELIFNLAPTALMTLGAPTTVRSSVDRLVETWLAFSGSRQHAALPPMTSRRAEFFETRQAERLRARTELAWAAAECAFPFHRSNLPEFCSQYDLLELGASWYVQPWAAETPLGEVGRMLRTVANIRNPRMSE